MHEACRWNNHRAELRLLCCCSLQVVVELPLLLRWKGRRRCSAWDALAENTRLPLVAAKGRRRQYDRSSADSQKAGEPPRHESRPSDCCGSTTAATTASKGLRAWPIVVLVHLSGPAEVSPPWLLRLRTRICSNLSVPLCCVLASLKEE